MDADKLWEPNCSADLPLRRFMRKVEDKYGVQFEGDYAKLHAWTCEDVGRFWGEVFHFSDLKASPYTKVLEDDVGMEWSPKWFLGSRLNYAQNLLKRKDDAAAIYFAGESLGDGGFRSICWRELRVEVGKYAGGLRELGVGKGDKVAAYMPNSISCVVAMLAATSLGAVWSSCSPDFGVTGVLDRFTQVEPKVLFSVTAVKYNGKIHDHTQKLEKVVKGLPSLQSVIILPFLDTSASNVEIEKAMDEEKFLKKERKSEEEYLEMEFEQVPFDHPLFIMFSSGTTGAPKCIIHSVGGTLIKHMAEHLLQGCLTPKDVLFFYTTVGWMMWNWLVSALATGSAIVLYDGSPVFPTPTTLFDLVDRIGVTTLGMGAKCISLFQQKSLEPKKSHNLSSLKAILSTGSPLNPQSYDYLYKSVKDDLLVGSISGGTDIIACFIGQSFLTPVYRGEIQVMCLGCDMDCWDDEGKWVRGGKGELVCRKPIPSMPTAFLNDPDRAKYHRAYFHKFPGVWSQGDFCTISSKTGGIVMLGRSDGTLNPGGVRFGSAEIYQVVEAMDGVEDSLCVGQKVSGGTDERVVLFLKLHPDTPFSLDLVTKVKEKIRRCLSARHVPSLIAPIADIPYTNSGKKVEMAVKQIISGEKVLNRGALRNPESLELFLDVPALELAL